MTYRVACMMVLLVSTARAESMTELTLGAGRMFDTSDDTTMTVIGVERTHVVHAKEIGVGGGASVGWFVSDHVAVAGRVALAIPSMLLFAGPAVKGWLGDTGLWLSGAAGWGYDGTCLGRSRTCGIDTCRCDDPSTLGLDARVGWKWSHSPAQTGTVALEFLELGTPGHGADAVTLQVGWEWR